MEEGRAICLFLLRLLPMFLFMGVLAGQLYPWMFIANVIFSDSIAEDNIMLVFSTTVMVWLLTLDANENEEFHIL